MGPKWSVRQRIISDDQNFGRINKKGLVVMGGTLKEFWSGKTKGSKQTCKFKI